MEQKTVVDTSLRELRRHGSDDFPIGIYRDDFSEFEHGQIAWHWHDEIQFDYIIKDRIQQVPMLKTSHLSLIFLLTYILFLLLFSISSDVYCVTPSNSCSLPSSD